MIIIFIFIILFILISICLYDRKIFLYNDSQIKIAVDKFKNLKYVKQTPIYKKEYFENLKLLFNYESYFLNNKILLLNNKKVLAEIYTSRFLESKNLFFCSCFSRLSDVENNFSGLVCTIRNTREWKQSCIISFTNDEDFLKNNKFSHKLINKKLKEQYNKNGLAFYGEDKKLLQKFCEDSFKNYFLYNKNFDNILIYITFYKNQISIFYSDSYTYNSKTLTQFFNKTLNNILNLIAKCLIID